MYRFRPAYVSLANSFWPRNVVIVTHGYGVQQAVIMGGGSSNAFTDYCGFVELTRTGKDCSEWTTVDRGNIDDFF